MPLNISSGVDNMNSVLLYCFIRWSPPTWSLVGKITLWGISHPAETNHRLFNMKLQTNKQIWTNQQNSFHLVITSLKIHHAEKCTFQILTAKFEHCLIMSKTQSLMEKKNCNQPYIIHWADSYEFGTSLMISTKSMTTITLIAHMCT